MLGNAMCSTTSSGGGSTGSCIMLPRCAGPTSAGAQLFPNSVVVARGRSVMTLLHASMIAAHWSSPSVAQRRLSLIAPGCHPARRAARLESGPTAAAAAASTAAAMAVLPHSWGGAACSYLWPRRCLSAGRSLLSASLEASHRLGEATRLHRKGLVFRCCPGLLTPTTIPTQGNSTDAQRRLRCIRAAVVALPLVAMSAAASKHAHTALMHVTQMAMTAAAVVCTAYLSPYADGIAGRDRREENQEKLIIEGLDLTEYRIFRHPEVQRAVEFAKAAHAGQVRKTGDAYITHCIHTGCILAALVPTEGERAVQTVVGGILHDVVDDTNRTLKDVQKHFGDDVAALVEGVSKLSHINQLLRRHRRTSLKKAAGQGLSAAEVESLRVMLLGMINDPRVVLIKLADRLHNMRTVYALPYPKARAVAQETLAIWCSLASRLGVWAVKAELEDLCFAVLKPQTFRGLRLRLSQMWTLKDGTKYYNRQHARRVMRRRQRALLSGNEDRQDKEGEKDEQLNNENLHGENQQLVMRELIESVIPFDVLLDRNRRTLRTAATALVCSQPADLRSGRFMHSAGIALASLSRCEDALARELLLTTPYVPGMEVTLSGRLKSLYSVHCKMRRKGIGLDQVYDARALRVIVGDGGGRWHVQAVEGCYHLLSIVHSLWPPICGEFDDYIVNPKPSGYQSLHTAVTGPDGAPLEVQIRTQGMHEQAEYGHAAHWMYKEERDMMDYATNAFPNAAGNEGGDTGRANGAKIINGDMLGMAQMVNANLSSEDDNEQQCEGRGLPARQQWGMWSPGHPALRVHQGKLLAAVVIRVENGGRELIVGVSFALLAREAVAAGRSGNQRKRWETYAKLYNKVKCSNWLEPGNGDWSTCLEKYTLCTDGMYHKEDCYGYKLPTYVQMLDLNSAEQNEYREIMARVADGEEGVSTESSMVEEKSSDDANGEVGKKEVASTRARLNNKVRLLREMLQWEQELRHEAATDGSVTVMDPEHPESAALMEVLVIRWPDGKIMRMPLGSTASDVSARAGLDARVVLINGKVAYPNTKLNDGDVVEIRSW